MEECLLEVTASDYAHFKYEGSMPILKSKIESYENQGALEKEFILKLKESMGKWDSEFENHEYYQSLEKYLDI